MKPIIVNERNKDRIASALDEVQKRSRTRTISVDCIYQFCAKANVAYGIHKKDLEGSSFDVDWEAQDFPNAYKYIPESTHFVVVYEKKHFLLVEVRRDTTRGRERAIEASLSDETKKAIIEHSSTMSRCRFRSF